MRVKSSSVACCGSVKWFYDGDERKVEGMTGHAIIQALLKTFKRNEQESHYEMSPDVESVGSIMRTHDLVLAFRRQT